MIAVFRIFKRDTEREVAEFSERNSRKFPLRNFAPGQRFA